MVTEGRPEEGRTTSSLVLIDLVSFCVRTVLLAPLRSTGRILPEQDRDPHDSRLSTVHGWEVQVESTSLDGRGSGKGGHSGYRSLTTSVHIFSDRETGSRPVRKVGGEERYP